LGCPIFPVDRGVNLLGNKKGVFWYHPADDEIYDIGKADLTAVSVWLGEKPFFMGATATSVDAIAYSFLANIIVPPLKSPLKDHGMSLPNLSAYCERMKNKYYET
jgi:glutathione S-transferase